MVINNQFTSYIYMAKIQMLKLGTTNTDKATNTPGMIAALSVDMEGGVTYSFQPHGLNKTDGSPLDYLYLEGPRFTDQSQTVEIDVPMDVLGSQVTDTASGFTGMATALHYHLTGCFHVVITPSTKTKDGEAVKSYNFDLRRCEGPNVPKWTEEARQADQVKRPSPGRSQMNDIKRF